MPDQQSPSPKRDAPSAATAAPVGGALLLDLDVLADHRGSVTEIHAASWGSLRAVQWTRFDSIPGSFRGVHAHRRKTDLVSVLHGTMFIGTHDLREDSSSMGTSALHQLSGGRPTLIVIPPGVGHGFYSLEPTVMLIGTTREYDPTDEYGCRWDDPMLHIDWPIDSEPLLSERDAQAGSLTDLLDAMRITDP